MDISKELKINDVVYGLSESYSASGQKEVYAPVKGVVKDIKENDSTVSVFLELVNKDNNPIFKDCNDSEIILFKKEGNLEKLYCPYGEGIFKTKDELVSHLTSRLG